jgi:hypothetical protein
MRRTLLVAICGVGLAGSLLSVAPPAQAAHPHGGIYSEGPADDSYRYVNDECKGLPYKVKGKVRGHEILYNVPGSGGQAFLQDLRYRYHEVWKNPANGRKVFASGEARVHEIKAERVKGDVWRFLTVLSGAPLVVKNDRDRIVLAEWGRLVFSAVFDTLGDHQPGGDIVSQKVISSRGHWPTWEKDFDFCGFVERVLG